MGTNTKYKNPDVAFRSTKLRRAIVAALASHGGRIDSPNGRCIELLRSMLPADLPATSSTARNGSLTGVVAQLEALGVIRRELSPGGGNTRSIVLVDPRGLLATNGEHTQPTLTVDRTTNRVALVDAPGPITPAQPPVVVTPQRRGVLELAADLAHLDPTVRGHLEGIMDAAAIDPDGIARALELVRIIGGLDPATREALVAIVGDYAPTGG